jgi:hypothetical protein
MMRSLTKTEAHLPLKYKQEALNGQELKTRMMKHQIAKSEIGCRRPTAANQENRKPIRHGTHKRLAATITGELEKQGRNRLQMWRTQGQGMLVMTML